MCARVRVFTGPCPCPWIYTPSAHSLQLFPSDEFADHVDHCMKDHVEEYIASHQSVPPQPHILSVSVSLPPPLLSTFLFLPHTLSHCLGALCVAVRVCSLTH